MSLPPQTTNIDVLSNEDMLPVGSILQYATGNVPEEYLECDGSEHLITLYPDLYSVIGLKFGGDAAR